MLFSCGTRHDGTTVNKVQSWPPLPPVPGPACAATLLCAISIRYTRARPIVGEKNSQPKVPAAFFLRSFSLRLSLAMRALFPSLFRSFPAVLPILISIMTRNGCWRECSSLSVAAVPLVYLSGTRAAPFHPDEKHGEAETAVSSLFFYVDLSPRPFARPFPAPPARRLPRNLRLTALHPTTTNLRQR